MAKKLFGVAIIVLLVSIAGINIMKDAQAKKAEEEAQEDFLKRGESEMATGKEDVGLKPGNVPPDFELATLDGKKVRLSELKGQKVILNFWATWCPPCKAEMPHMENFYKEHAKQDNVEILAVNLTAAERGTGIEKKVQDFVTDFGLTFPIPMDQKGLVGEAYQVFTIPTSFIIDSHGVIQRRHVGPMDESMMKSFTEEIE